MRVDKIEKTIVDLCETVERAAAETGLARRHPLVVDVQIDILFLLANSLFGWKRAAELIGEGRRRGIKALESVETQ